MTTDLDTLWRTVVGIVGDIRQRSPDLEPRHAMYLPHAQWPSTDPNRRESLASLMKRADRAMYDVKHGGKSGLAIAPDTPAEDAA